jgi:hypothetical protein
MAESEIENQSGGVPEWYVAGADARGRQASGSESIQLGEKDGHIRGRSKLFRKYPG